MKLWKWIAIYKGNNLDQIIAPVLLYDVLEIVSVTYDKLIFYANDNIVKA